MRYHYTASRKKDRGTQEGQAWFESEIKDYVGGENGVKWQQEMEINFAVRDSARVWPDFHDMMGYVVCPEIEIEEHWPVYLGYDYGSKEVSVFMALAFASEQKCYIFDEIWMPNTPILHQYDQLRAKPYFDRIQWPVWGDPSIWSASQQQEEEVTSIGDLWRDEYNIDMGRGKNFIGSDAAFIDLLNSVLWADKENPRLQITENCTRFLAELRTLSWREPPQHSQDKNPARRIAGKNVHCFDAAKYVTLETWKGTAPQPSEMPVGCIDWALQQMAAMAGASKYHLNVGWKRR